MNHPCEDVRVMNRLPSLHARSQAESSMAGSVHGGALHRKVIHMPKRLSERQQLALKLETLSDSEIVEVLEYIALIEPTRKATVIPSAWDDELVSLLSEAQENKRARQAFAWEAVRRRAERLTGLPGPRAS